MRITFFSGTTSLDSKKIGAQNALGGYATVRHTTPGGPITKVRIELFHGSLNPADGVLVYTDDISRCIPAGRSAAPSLRANPSRSNSGGRSASPSLL